MYSAFPQHMERIVLGQIRRKKTVALQQRLKNKFENSLVLSVVSFTFTMASKPNNFYFSSGDEVCSIIYQKPRLAMQNSESVCLLLQVAVMVQENGKRKKPNILVTGTPGTGKTTVCTALAEATQLCHINVGELVKEKNLHDGWDDELDCYLLNEDLVSYQFI